MGEERRSDPHESLSREQSPLAPRDTPPCPLMRGPAEVWNPSFHGVERLAATLV